MRTIKLVLVLVSLAGLTACGAPEQSAPTAGGKAESFRLPPNYNTIGDYAPASWMRFEGREAAAWAEMQLFDANGKWVAHGVGNLPFSLYVPSYLNRYNKDSFGIHVAAEAFAGNVYDYTLTCMKFYQTEKGAPAQHWDFSVNLGQSVYGGATISKAAFPEFFRAIQSRPGQRGESRYYGLTGTYKCVATHQSGRNITWPAIQGGSEARIKGDVRALIYGVMFENFVEVAQGADGVADVDQSKPAFQADQQAQASGLMSQVGQTALQGQLVPDWQQQQAQQR